MFPFLPITHVDMHKCFMSTQLRTPMFICPPCMCIYAICMYTHAHIHKTLRPTITIPSFPLVVPHLSMFVSSYLSHVCFGRDLWHMVFFLRQEQWGTIVQRPPPPTHLPLYIYYLSSWTCNCVLYIPT